MSAKQESGSGRRYIETFEEGPGGWIGWTSNFVGPRALEWSPGSITSRSPWWIDYNHAPPGAGYLHFVAGLSTFGPQSAEPRRERGGHNHFVAGNYPTDFTGAAVTVRSHGELHLRGAELVVLLQGNVEGICTGWICTGQPIRVEEEGATTTVDLVPDPAQWTPLGVRHDRTDTYGVKPLDRLLAGVDASIILILFPLDVAPMGPIDGDPHRLRPQEDYPVWHGRLPEGYIVIEEIAIQFAR